MNWTDEQQRVLDHPHDAHAVVRAAPGAGKTTLLVGRVKRLIADGVDPTTIRVVMFNKAVQLTFVRRLGNPLVRVSTFDALGYEVLRAADRAGALSRTLHVQAELTSWIAQEVFKSHGDHLDEASDIERAVGFWKSHLVTPGRARFPEDPKLVEAYAQFEQIRLSSPTLQIGLEDLVYTAVHVLRAHPEISIQSIDHLLVDEFQDVNPGRVELMQRLIRSTTSVMVVGDEDQGINEWCGGHPRYFRDFGTTFAGLSTREYRLSRTFRFGPALAQAASQLIAFNKERAPGIIVGGGATGQIVQTTDIASDIRMLLATGTAPTDIAVHYRSRIQGADVISRLMRANIPVHTEDAALLQKGRGPELALAYLQAAASSAPMPFQTAWPLVSAPGRWIRKEAFQAQLQARSTHSLRDVLRSGTAPAQTVSGVKAMKQLAGMLDRMARCTTAAAALDMLLREVKIAEQLRAWIRSESSQELAIASFHGLHALLRERGTPLAEARNAVAAIDPHPGIPISGCVRSCTIHKAKGLEWKHVFLPSMVEGVCPSEERGHVVGSEESPEGIAQTPWIEQERRIFYVGVTRAIEICHIHAPGPSPSRFVKELDGVETYIPPKPRPATPISRAAAHAFLSGMRPRELDR